MAHGERRAVGGGKAGTSNGDDRLSSEPEVNSLGSSILLVTNNFT